MKHVLRSCKTPECQERGMIVLVVMADVFTCSPLYISGESYSRRLISQTVSRPTLPFCFHSITCTITDGCGPLSKDKAGVISPLAFLDTWIAFGSRTETHTQVCRLVARIVCRWNSSIKWCEFIFLSLDERVLVFGPLKWNNSYFCHHTHTHTQLCWICSTPCLKPWHTPYKVNSSKLR